VGREEIVTEVEGEKDQYIIAQGGIKGLKTGGRGVKW